MKCSLCGHEFNEQDAQKACAGCGIIKNCELVKCPECGFESAPEPKWLRKLKERRRKNDPVRKS